MLPHGLANGAAPRGSSAYYSLRFAPAALRADLGVLHAWRHTMREALDRVSDPGVAAAKLDWWREELGRTVAGRPTHPLTHRLAETIGRFDLPRGVFLDQIRSAEAELAGRAPDDFAALAGLARDDLGALFELVLRVHSGAPDAERTPNPLGLECARMLGAYASLVYGIRDSGLHLRRGRLGFAPTDLLTALGIAPSDLTRPGGQERLARLLDRLARETRGLRDRTRADDLDPALLPATLRIRVRILDRLLAELAASRFDVADRRLGLTPLRKLRIAWLESRRKP